MYEVILHSKAGKEYNKLPERINTIFTGAMLALRDNPYPFREYDLKKLKGTENMFRIRVGDYRMVYTIEKKLKRVVVLKIGRRGKVY
jgi:mRNA interferase RelE/StbE